MRYLIFLRGEGGFLWLRELYLDADYRAAWQDYQRLVSVHGEDHVELYDLWGVK